MKNTLYLIALLSISSQLVAIGQQNPTPATAPRTQETVLKATGIPAGKPLSVLPKGALFHLQFNNLETLAHDLNDLIVSAALEKAVPQ